MKKNRFAVSAVGLLAIGSSAVAQTASPTGVDLGRGKASGPFSFEAKDTSDVVMHKFVFDAAGRGNTWHSHPPLFAIVKAGSVTVHTGNASGCTSKTYTAGQAIMEPDGVPHVHESSHDVEIQVTFLGVPVGAAVAKNEPAPTGPNCPTRLATGLAGTELSRSTIQGASRAAATGDSEMLMQFGTIPAKTNVLESWYSSPAAVFASMKSGSLTVFTGDAISCTSKTFSAGQGIFVPAGQVIFARNDGSTPVEVYATRLAHPVGAALRVDAQDPAGLNCPHVAAASISQLPRTGGAAGALVMLGLGLAGVGTVARAFGRRR